MKTEAPRRLRHIVDTMSYSPLPEVAGSSTPKPLPAVPVNVTPAPLPIPTSSFSTYVPFRSKCGHITMSRVYHPGLRCQRCLKYGAFGWLYGCTEQREWILDDMHRRGSKVSLTQFTTDNLEKRYDTDNVSRFLSMRRVNATPSRCHWANGDRTTVRTSTVSSKR